MRAEPLRIYLGGVLAALVAVLVAYGIIEADQAPLWIALGTAVLGIGGVEAARSRVTPVDTLGDEAHPDVGDELPPDDVGPAGAI